MKKKSNNFLFSSKGFAGNLQLILWRSPSVSSPSVPIPPASESRHVRSDRASHPPPRKRRRSLIRLPNLPPCRPLPPPAHLPHHHIQSDARIRGEFGKDLAPRQLPLGLLRLQLGLQSRGISRRPGRTRPGGHERALSRSVL